MAGADRTRRSLVGRVLDETRPAVMMTATALVVCGMLLWGFEARNNQRLYDNQISECERGSVLRGVIHEFLQAAEKARRSPPVDLGDLEAAASYARLDAQIWPVQPCSSIIEKP